VLVLVLDLRLLWDTEMNRVEKRQNIILTNTISGFVMVLSDEK
jgi:hypothetical protein